MASWASLIQKYFLNSTCILRDALIALHTSPTSWNITWTPANFWNSWLLLAFFLTDIWLCIYTDFRLHYNVFFWLIALLLGSMIFLLPCEWYLSLYPSVRLLSSRFWNQSGLPYKVDEFMEKIYGSLCSHQEPTWQDLSNRQGKGKLGSFQDHSQGPFAFRRLLLRKFQWVHWYGLRKRTAGVSTLEVWPENLALSPSETYSEQEAFKSLVKWV